jgi:hypothetical protein
MIRSAAKLPTRTGGSTRGSGIGPKSLSSADRPVGAPQDIPLFVAARYLVAVPAAATRLAIAGAGGPRVHLGQAIVGGECCGLAWLCGLRKLGVVFSQLMIHFSTACLQPKCRVRRSTRWLQGSQ